MDRLRQVPPRGSKFSPEKGVVWVMWLFKKFKTSFNISGMNEATLFKFGKWIDYCKSHPEVKFPRKGRGLGHVTLFKILNPL